MEKWGEKEEKQKLRFHCISNYILYPIGVQGIGHQNLGVLVEVKVWDQKPFGMHSGREVRNQPCALSF